VNNFREMNKYMRKLLR